MCGIAGILEFNNGAADAGTIRRMTERHVTPEVPIADGFFTGK